MSDDKNLTPLTPLMRQYFDIKIKYPDTILLFQVGDFYELFFEDAQKAAAILGIALTQRGTYNGQPIPLCGVPLHVVDLYLSKLVRAGFKVALCDQLEQARPGRVVERGVTQVLTPGTLTDSKLLDEKSASYLAVFFPTELSWTLLFAELLTGQLFVTILANKTNTLLDAELQRFMPDEILVPESKLGTSFGTLLQSQGYAVSFEQYQANTQEDLAVGTDKVQAWFAGQFTQPPFSLTQSDGLSGALALLYSYLKRNNEQGLAELKHLSFYKPEDYLMLDATTQRNLELVKNTQDGSSAHTLFSVLDCAITAMGSRMIKKWILRPLIKKEHIEERLQAVESCMQDHLFKNELRGALATIGDLERVVGRIALRRAQLYDYMALLKALSAVPNIKALLSKKKEASLLASIATKICDLSSLESLLNASLNCDSSKEWLIKQGYDAELDRLRKLVDQGSHAVLAMEAAEQKATGIGSLKIRYNQVHGYGIEITNPNLHLAPSHYLRTQTLANRERFTTQELKNLEADLHRARTEINHVEKEVFERVKAQVEKNVPALKKLAYALAYADALAALAHTAYVQRYVRPTFNDDHEIAVVDGRHPVIEVRLKSQFIPNGVHLHEESSLWLITGPNMGGKSTFLRQVALITLMAQMGSFVPAARAHLSLVDRIFTRIGAADNLAEGKSTFLVEMEETALICNQSTRNSLVILDEVGRGTSTFDGLAIAQAVVEYMYTHIKARCLFATHYHELTALCEKFDGIKPYYAASTRTREAGLSGAVDSVSAGRAGVVLLHKIMPGIADGSFGLEVAAVAQVPAEVIARAREILAHLTVTQQVNLPEIQAARVASLNGNGSNGISAEWPLQEGSQLGVTPLEMSPAVHQDVMSAQAKKMRETERLIAAELSQLDCESLTAKQALELVWRLKESLS